MNMSLKMRLALGILSAAGCQLYASGGHAQDADRQTVVIYVYDLAGASSRTLNQTTEGAGRILASAGVEAVWRLSPADASEAHECDMQGTSHGTSSRRPESRDHLVLRPVRDFPERYLPGAMGYSLPDASFGVHATVFYDRIKAVSRTGDVSLSMILGHVIAHEIGHVLLGTIDHSPTGIMKARWGTEDYQQAGMGLMKFTAREGEAIRNGAAFQISARAQR